MEFRLIYKGRLPSAAKDGRVNHKHFLRKQLHGQLKNLWDTSPYYQKIADAAGGTEALSEKWKRIGSKYSIDSKDSFRFVPLIQIHQLTCSLNILFMRRDVPGSVVGSKGDIDNRIKTLFDGLTIPDGDQLGSNKPDPGETPFFCLLEDDKSIVDVKITTD